MQGVHGEQDAGEHCSGRTAKHAADGGGEQDGHGSVEGDVDHVIAERAQLVKVVVEAEGDGCEGAVAEVRARLKHIPPPQVLSENTLPVTVPMRILVLGGK